ncbi:MAG: DUF4331 domain-containing protein [Nitrospirae bacterium]|nr:DUF4331 domain-containing protein [Nitrospirota bacterium]
MKMRPHTALTATLLALALASPSFAASHREAPLIALDPAGDITDFYAFRSPEDPSKAVLVMNVIPGQEPSSAPNYFNFDDQVLYEIEIDNNRDNVAEDIVYQVRFTTEIRPPADFFALSYVAVPPITVLNGSGSEGLLLRQRYTVTETRRGQEPRDLGQGVMFAVPSNVGPRTMPHYEVLAAQGVYPLTNGGRVFAGQRDETFYLDLGGIFDTLNVHAGPILSTSDDADDTRNVSGAVDAFSGFNVNTIAIEVPITDLLGPHGNALIGAYATTSRPKVTVLKKDGRREHSERFIQIARMGNPLVNELIIPTTEKDRWNAVPAEKEGQFLKAYCSPSLATAINLVFGTPFPTANREDLVNVLLRYTPGPAVCAAGETKERLADLLRLNLTQDPTPVGAQKRLGILAHDAAGNSTPDPAAWPNGRRPNDDVVDIALRVVAGALLGPVPYLGDGVNFNSGASGTHVTANGIATPFPFLPTPHDGRDRRHVDPGETP